jgi:hypothetical protein
MMRQQDKKGIGLLPLDYLQLDVALLPLASSREQHQHNITIG